MAIQDVSDMVIQVDLPKISRGIQQDNKRLFGKQLQIGKKMDYFYSSRYNRFLFLGVKKRCPLGKLRVHLLTLQRITIIEYSMLYRSLLIAES